MSAPNRRAALLSALGGAALASPALAATQPATGENDRLLLALHAERLAAQATDEAECRAADRAEHEAGDKAAAAVHEAAMEAAWDAYCSVMERMAGLPADGLVGIAVKAAVACRAVDVGVSDGERLVVDSLAADLARLLPGGAA